MGEGGEGLTETKGAPSLKKIYKLKHCILQLKISKSHKLLLNVFLKTFLMKLSAIHFPEGFSNFATAWNHCQESKDQKN